MMKYLFLFFIFGFEVSAQAQSSLPSCNNDYRHNCYDTKKLSNGLYRGEFKNNLYHGQGTRKYSSGNTYVGDWVNGEKNGNGSFLFSNGDKYIGTYKNDERVGNGKYVFANGSIYEGEFKNYTPHGIGTITGARGIQQKGVFKDGSLVKEYWSIRVQMPSSTERPRSGNNDNSFLSMGNIVSGLFLILFIFFVSITSAKRNKIKREQKEKLDRELHAETLRLGRIARDKRLAKDAEEHKLLKYENINRLKEEIVSLNKLKDEFLTFQRKKIDKSRNKYDKLIETVSNEQNALKELETRHPVIASFLSTRSTDDTSKKVYSDLASQFRKKFKKFENITYDDTVDNNDDPILKMEGNIENSEYVLINGGSDVTNTSDTSTASDTSDTSTASDTSDASTASDTSDASTDSDTSDASTDSDTSDASPASASVNTNNSTRRRRRRR